MWLLFFLLLTTSAFAQGNKEEIVFPDKPYPPGLTRNSWFAVTDAKGLIKIEIEFPARDPTVEIKVNLVYSDDGGKTARVDKDGNTILGCGATWPASSWVDRQGNPITKRAVTCKSQGGDKDLPNGVMYSPWVVTNKAIPGLRVTTTFDKK